MRKQLSILAFLVITGCLSVFLWSMFLHRGRIDSAAHVHLSEQRAVNHRPQGPSYEPPVVPREEGGGDADARPLSPPPRVPRAADQLMELDEFLAEYAELYLRAMSRSQDPEQQELIGAAAQSQVAEDRYLALETSGPVDKLAHKVAAALEAAARADRIRFLIAHVKGYTSLRLVDIIIDSVGTAEFPWVMFSGALNARSAEVRLAIEFGYDDYPRMSLPDVVAIRKAIGRTPDQDAFRIIYSPASLLADHCFAISTLLPSESEAPFRTIVDLQTWVRQNFNSMYYMTEHGSVAKALDAYVARFPHARSLEDEIVDLVGTGNSSPHIWGGAIAKLVHAENFDVARVIVAIENIKRLFPAEKAVEKTVFWAYPAAAALATVAEGASEPQRQGHLERLVGQLLVEYDSAASTWRRAFLAVLLGSVVTEIGRERLPAAQFDQVAEVLHAGIGDPRLVAHQGWLNGMLIALTIGNPPRSVGELDTAAEAILSRYTGAERAGALNSLFVAAANLHASSLPFDQERVANVLAACLTATPEMNLPWIAFAGFVVRLGDTSLASLVLQKIEAVGPIRGTPAQVRSVEELRGLARQQEHR